MSIKLLSITTSFAALSILMPSLTYARPPVELVQDAQIPHTIAGWHRANKLSPQPIRLAGGEPIAGAQKGDVVLWETYAGQPIAVGDLFIADYASKGLVCAIRECGRVSPTSITTVSGTTIPLTEVRGIVRRVIRVVQ